MPSLVERLRDALAPRYEVQAEIATGGMAVVFRAVDTALGRPVAVKVLRPDLATATAEERFQREARTLASFSHPNVVAVHDVGETDGISYYVMDLVEGETLAERLKRGPLDGRDSFRLGRGVLNGLERIHEAGVVHRDVKPSNIFLVGDRVLLADFGVAHLETAAEDSLTSADGPSPGTPAYMAPEQTDGDPVGPATDLYALALVLYEAICGRRWPAGLAPEAGDWRDIPLPARRALRRALELDPAARWPDAASFRSALRTRGPGVRVPRWALVLAVGLAVPAATIFLSTRHAERSSEGLLDVAVFPCRSLQEADSSLAFNIGDRVALNLQDMPQVRIASRGASFSLWEDRAGDVSPSAWTGSLRARHAMFCAVDRTAEGLTVTYQLLDEGGSLAHRETFRVSGTANDVLARSAAVSLSILSLQDLADVTVTPEEVDRLAPYGFDAVSHFFLAENLLRRGAWKPAEEYYSRALAEDSTFTLARLRRAEARRWLAHREIGEDLSDILDRDTASLSPLNLRLLRAGVERRGPRQLEAFEAILRPESEYRWDPYATLLYADELYHRGALWGIPIDSAVTMLQLAVHRDTFLVPAVEHLTQAYIRVGRRDDAADLLPHLRKIHAPREESGEPYFPFVWDHGFRERFAPDEVEEGRQALAAAPPEMLAMYARWVRYIDSPATQIALGRYLASTARQERAPDLLAEGFIAQGLGHVTSGRILGGLAAFDSAASYLPTLATEIQAAEWRVVPFALGLEGFTGDEAVRGERVLRAAWNGDPDDAPNRPLRARAAWALALLSQRRGDARAGQAWTDSVTRLEPREISGRLTSLLEANGLAAERRFREALDATAGGLEYDSAGLAARPFYRSALYLLRGSWYRDLGQPDSAVASWMWHENTDLEGTVSPQLVQAGEVDGALGVHARARIVGSSTDEHIICSRARDVERLWVKPDSVLVPLQREIVARLEDCTQ